MRTFAYAFLASLVVISAQAKAPEPKYVGRFCLSKNEPECYEVHRNAKSSIEILPDGRSEISLDPKQSGDFVSALKLVGEASSKIQKSKIQSAAHGTACKQPLIMKRPVQKQASLCVDLLDAAERQNADRLIALLRGR